MSFYRTPLRNVGAPHRARRRTRFLTQHATPQKEVKARKVEDEVDHLKRAPKALPAAGSVAGIISMGSAPY